MSRSYTLAPVGVEEPFYSMEHVPRFATRVWRTSGATFKGEVIDHAVVKTDDAGLCDHHHRYPNTAEKCALERIRGRSR